VYGQTETYGNCCVTWHHWPLEHRAACQGPPLPGVTIRIVDEALASYCRRTGPGLIEVKGHVMRGYIVPAQVKLRPPYARRGFFAPTWAN